jgi:arsenate reductase-like glutaredoxin family protein
MLTTEYLSPYSLLTGQYLGVIRTIVSNSKTTKESAIEDFDVFDDLDESIVFEASKQSATVKINNVVVGEVDLPVSEVDVYVNVTNPSIPFIKNPNEFIHSATVVANSIVTNPGESLLIMIDQSHVRSKYGEQDAAFTIEVVNIEQGEGANVESMINVESYFATIASTYITKVYGVKMEQGPQDILEKTKEFAEKVGEKIREKIKDKVLTPEEKRILEDPFVKIYMKVRDIIEKFIREVIAFFGKLKAELSQILSKIGSHVESIVRLIKDFVSHYPAITTTIATASLVGIIMLIMKKRAVRVAAREFASIPNDKLTYAVLDDIASVLIVTNPTLNIKQVAKEAVSIFEQAGKKGINNFKKLASKFVSKEAQVKVSQRKANPGVIPALVGILKVATPVVGAGIFGFVIGLLTALNTDKVVEFAKQVQDTTADVAQKSGEVVEKIDNEVKQTTGKSLIEKLQQVYSDIPTFAKVGIGVLIGAGVILVGAKILQTLRKRRIVFTSVDINKVKQDVKNMNNRVFAFAYTGK